MLHCCADSCLHFMSLNHGSMSGQDRWSTITKTYHLTYSARLPACAWAYCRTVPMHSHGLVCIAGGLSRLQRLENGQAGNQWASAGRALGRFLYSTYTEGDYDVIWRNYMYISQDNWWVEYDFGKKNCSAAGPRRADVAARLEEVWAHRVCNHLSQYISTMQMSPELNLGLQQWGFLLDACSIRLQPFQKPHMLCFA